MRRQSDIIAHYVRSPLCYLELLGAACGPLRLANSMCAWLALARLFSIYPFLKKVESSTHVSPNTVRTAIMTAVTFLCLHWIACVWTSLASLEPEGGTWFERQNSNLKDLPRPPLGPHHLLGSTTCESSRGRTRATRRAASICGRSTGCSPPCPRADSATRWW